MLELDWNVILLNLSQIGIAYVLALPIAWDREQEARSAGLRTFPLVSVAACGYMLTGIQALDSTDAEARVIHASIAGMGFIGGGAILKGNGNVKGTATAASLWMAGAIGIAVAFHRYEIAVVLALLNFLTLKYVKRLKK
ncbi:MAG: MgtC/SapB family protein [Xanthomonadales bacterium]|nr:MgtC/SapB family protein [Xanthomonadales bacterium]